MHLTDWPGPDELPRDAALVAAMDRVRQVASAALSLRKARGLRVRLPLARLTVAAPDAETLAPFADILRDEVNVKDVELTTDVAAHGRFEIAVNARACGPRLGRRHPEGDPRGQGGGVGADRRRHGDRGRDRAAAGRVHRAAGRRRPGRRPPRCRAAPGWSCSTPRSPRSSPPRAWRATSSGWCSRPAATPGWTSPTGSRSPSTAPRPCSTRSGPTRRSSPARCSPTSVAYAPVAEPTLAGTVADGLEVRVHVAP